MSDEDAVLEYTTRRSNQRVESVFVRRTEDPAYPCGWKYSLHYGTLDGDTILRYDNAHERTKGHERHTGNSPDEVQRIEFPGMDELLSRFYRELGELG